MKKLSDQEIKKQLEGLTFWKIVNGKLSRSFVFKDFNEAFGFMSKVASVCEEMDHHPEWSNVYNRVEVLLSTHDVQGITMRDMDLAQKIENLI